MTRQSDYGYSEFENILYNMDVQVVPYDHGDLSASDTLTIPVPAGTIVVAVGHETMSEAFAGGTPALTIGDGTTADLFAAAADAITLAGGPLAANGFKLVFKGGKKYATAGVIVLTHATGLTAGKGQVHIFKYTPKGNWRVPDPS